MVLEHQYPESYIILFEMVCVIIVAAYMITRTKYFTEILEQKLTLKNQIILGLIFGAVSIYGTLSGIEVLGAPINVRDLGPMVGGLSCGPVVGILAGAIGTLFRLTQGGPTILPCSVATFLAGIFGGLIFLANKKKFPKIKHAILFAALMEILHMGLVLLICRPFAEALEIVRVVAVPMIFANTAGMFIFAYIITNLTAERATTEELNTKKAELRVAAEIQHHFLPGSIPSIEGFDIAAFNIPAKEIGGDFYDFIRLDDRKTGVAIADVSGKSVPAALFMALSRTILRANASWHKDIVHVITNANNMITSDSESGMFVTLFYGVLDAPRQTLTYVNAGHNPPILYDSNNGEFTTLTLTGMALGVMEDIDYTKDEVMIDSGKMLVLYTDGVTEAINENNEQFGEERLMEIIRKNSGRTSAELINLIKSEITHFSDEEPQFDDITLMILKAL